jgi:zinc/manganese transport system permease protein
VLSHPFFVHALVAGTAIAIAAGLVGYFLVLRAQVFTGDALSHVAFTGALAALALGVDARFGLYGATLAVGVLLAVAGRRGRPDDVAIGNVFSFLLGLGVFFLTLYTTTRSAGNGTAGVAVLFGSIFGISTGQLRLTIAISVVIVVVMLVIARPLLFASLDEPAAAGRGVPVRWLGIVFLALAGLCAAQATQAVGALPLLGLLAAPAGAAHLWTRRPYAALGLSAGLALAAVWIGLAASYFIPRMPPTFGIVAAATASYGLALLIRPRRRSQL